MFFDNAFNVFISLVSLLINFRYHFPIVQQFRLQWTEMDARGWNIYDSVAGRIFFMPLHWWFHKTSPLPLCPVDEMSFIAKVRGANLQCNRKTTRSAQATGTAPHFGIFQL